MRLTDVISSILKRGKDGWNNMVYFVLDTELSSFSVVVFDLCRGFPAWTIHYYSRRLLFVVRIWGGKGHCNLEKPTIIISQDVLFAMSCIVPRINVCPSRIKDNADN